MFTTRQGAGKENRPEVTGGQLPAKLARCEEVTPREQSGGRSR